MQDKSSHSIKSEQETVELISIDVPFEESDRALWEDKSLPRRHDPYEEIAVKTNDTANRIVQVLIWGFVLSFPFLTISLFVLQLWPGSNASSGTFTGLDVYELLTKLFDKWLAVMSALAGAAFGFYFGVNRKN